MKLLPQKVELFFSSNLAKLYVVILVAIVNLLASIPVYSQNLAPVLTRPERWYDPHYPYLAEDIYADKRQRSYDLRKQLPLQGFSEALFNRTTNPDTADSAPLYLYEAILYKAAGVTNTDNDTQKGKKMQVFFENYAGQLLFQNTIEDLTILKLIFFRDNDYFFLEDAAKWRLPFNKVDVFDGGRTLLDYIADHYEFKGRPKDIQKIYTTLKLAGAKHRFELQQEGSFESMTTLQQKAAASHIAAANKGQIESMLYLGNIYQDGRYIKADRAEAEKWYLLAEEQSIRTNNFKMLVTLADIYERNKNITRSVAVQTIGAEKGDATAMLRLGKRYLFGDGVGKDLNKAVKWLLASEAKGEWLGGMFVGRAYFELDNITEGTKWLRYVCQTRGRTLDIYPGVTVEDFLASKNINPCGINAKGYDGCKR